MTARTRAKPVRGTVSQVIVVKEPGPCFREALFILRDEALADPKRDREALLREAREAAAAFTGVKRRRLWPPPRWVWYLLPTLLALAAGVVIWLLL